MTQINSSLRKKAFGIMKSIESMNDTERSSRPSEAFGKNYNKLLELTRNNNQDLFELLPPAVEFDDYGGSGYSNRLTVHDYSEIHTFCSEIYQLLDDA